MKPRTGSVFYSKPDKCYIAKISATHPITKKIKEWKRHAPTSVEAHKKIRELQQLADDWIAREGPEDIDPNRMTFADLAKIFESRRLTEAKYVDGHKVSGLRSLTGPRAWLADLTNYLGTKRLKSIRFTDLEDFKSYLIGRPKKRGGQRGIAAINRELAFLSTVLNFAVANGYLDRNPFHASEIKLIKRPQEDARDRMPGFGEDLAILAQCQDWLEWLIEPFVIAVDTGLRRNEMLTLAISDLDFTEGVIHLRRGNTKANKPRDISMTARARAAFQELCKNNESDLVFWELVKPLPSGRQRSEPKPYQRQECYILGEMWREAKRRAGIVNLRWHDLRHAFVSRSILAGIPPAAVLKASGHSSDEWKRYLNMTPDQLRGLLRPLPGQGVDEVRLYAARVMKGLRDALGYEEIERLFDLLKD